ncbi:hypothetical protein GLYMA_14G079450v4 [Glycine max]|nr:hypothetical protein GLYMA_14G079450v4 [Glycine max]KAH1093582.1 hypothetical protein GYH30_039359 [Glycine max]
MLQLCVGRRFLIFHLAHADYVSESGSPNKPTPTVNATQKRFLASSLRSKSSFAKPLSSPKKRRKRSESHPFSLHLSSLLGRR